MPPSLAEKDLHSRPLIVQASQQNINNNVQETLTFTLPATTLYQLSVYADSREDIGDNTLTIAAQWTDPSGVAANNPLITLQAPTVKGQFSNVVLVEGGTAVTITATFGASPFHYDLSLKIVAMP